MTADDRLTALAVSPGDAWVAVGDASGRIFCYGAKSGEKLAAIQAHPRRVYDAAIARRAGSTLVTAGSEGLRSWMLPALAPLAERELADEGPVASVTLSPDGNRAACVLLGGEHRVVVLAPAKHSPVRVLRTAAPSWRRGRALYSSDAALLACSLGDALHLWDGRSIEPLGSMDLGNRVAHAISPELPWRIALLDGLGVHLEVLDLESDSRLAIPTHVHDGMDGAVFSPDGRRIAFGLHYEARVEEFDAVTAVQMRVYEDLEASAVVLAYADEGRTLLSAGTDRALIWWDTASGRAVRKVSVPEVV